MRRNSSVRAWLAIVVAVVTFSPAVFAQQDTGWPAAWTKAEALEQLRLAPRDPFLQFVVIQMCLRDGNFAEAMPYLLPSLSARGIGTQRNRQIDLYRIFSGSLAIQETLQLDALAGPLNAIADVRVPLSTAVPGGGVSPRLVPGQRPILVDRELGDVHQTQRDPRGSVPVSQLQGPTVQSHPWAKMLGDKDPAVSALALCVPSDQLYIRFDSIGDLNRARQRVDQLANYLSNQVGGRGFNSQVVDRLETQLWLETHEFLKPIYDVAVSEVAITSSDLFFREGTDTTVILRLKQADVARQTLDQFLGLAKQRRSDVTLVEGNYAGVDFKHLSTPDRTIHCYSANPTPELHVRSNSRVAFERVLDTILERGNEATKIERLGDTDEFRYIRSLYPLGDDFEQGFIYLSDPFIRRLIGPEKKLTQRNRMICRSRLQLLGYASLLQRTQTGQPPATVDDSLQSGWLGTDKYPVTIACPDGGTYTLSENGLLAACSHHGHPESMIPCCELPLKSVGHGEAAEYRQFVENYSQYWSTFFDPIAIRIQLEPKRTRIETIILPLINNSIYQGLASMLGGAPEPLDSLPVSEQNIFSVAVKLNKPMLLEQAGFDTSRLSGGDDRESVQPKQANLITIESSLRSIALGLHNHHAAHNSLPPNPLSIERNGKTPDLSWRVQLLPFVGELALYDKFRLDEPWDSEHNRTLIEKMPAVYASAAPDRQQAGKTRFVFPRHSNAMHSDPQQGAKFRDVTDGLSNTIMVVVADPENAVTWTKPDDLEIDMELPRRGWFAGMDGQVSIALADGSIARLPIDATNEQVARLLTRNGNEVIESPPLPVSGPRFPTLGNRRRGQFSSLADSPFVQELGLEDFLIDGIGNQIGFHVCDSDPPIDFSVSRMLGLLAGVGQNSGGGFVGPTEMAIAVLASSLNAPVYLSIPVKDAEIVDRFLSKLDDFLIRLVNQPELRRGFPFLNIEHDAYGIGDESAREFRAYSLQFGPLTWRFYWGRIGNGLFIASKPYLIRDISRASQATSGRSELGQSPSGHAMVRIRPQHWSRILPHFQIGWAEAQRRSCLHNVSFLSSAARGLTSATGRPAVDTDMSKIKQLTRTLFHVEPHCGASGKYTLTDAGTGVCCTAHGCQNRPRQAMGQQTELAAFAESLTDVQLQMTFAEDGLHTLVTFEND